MSSEKKIATFESSLPSLFRLMQHQIRVLTKCSTWPVRKVALQAYKSGCSDATAGKPMSAIFWHYGCSVFSDVSKKGQPATHE